MELPYLDNSFYGHYTESKPKTQWRYIQFLLKKLINRKLLHVKKQTKIMSKSTDESYRL